MQQLSKLNEGITLLFIAVDTLSRFLCIVPLQRKIPTICRQTLKDSIEIVKSGHKDYQPSYCRGPNAVAGIDLG